jgi:hypothetical protein
MSLICGIVLATNSQMHLVAGFWNRRKWAWACLSTASFHTGSWEVLDPNSSSDMDGDVMDGDVMESGAVDNGAADSGAADSSAVESGAMDSDVAESGVGSDTARSCVAERGKRGLMHCCF